MTIRCISEFTAPDDAVSWYAAGNSIADEDDNIMSITDVHMYYYADDLELCERWNNRVEEFI